MQSLWEKRWILKYQISEQELRTMRLKTLFVLLSIALFVTIEPVRADKNYQVVISRVAKIGSVQLQPGEYKLVLDDSSAHFTEVNSGEEFEVLAKIDNTAEKKFEHTAIHSKGASGETLITEIRLGGTKTIVAFP
jgi:hypothetical protein